MLLFGLMISYGISPLLGKVQSASLGFSYAIVGSGKGRGLCGGRYHLNTPPFKSPPARAWLCPAVSAASPPLCLKLCPLFSQPPRMANGPSQRMRACVCVCVCVRACAGDRSTFLRNERRAAVMVLEPLCALLIESQVVRHCLPWSQLAYSRA